jgi:hypothetical protein
MPGVSLPPDVVNALRDLQRRVEDLERKNRSRQELSSHPRSQDLNGSGANSSAVAGSNVATYPDAFGSGATAVGNGTRVGDQAVGIGEGASAFQGGDVAIGKDSDADAIDATAVGHNTGATHDHSAAFGADAFTSNTNQIVLGSNLDRTIQAALTTGVPSPSDLSQGQMSWHRDEGASQLIVEIKFSSGAVKTGTIALT